MSDVARLLQQEAAGLAASGLMEQIAPTLDAQIAEIDRRVAEDIRNGTLNGEKAMLACCERHAIFALVRKLAAKATAGRAASGALAKHRDGDT